MRKPFGKNLGAQIGFLILVAPICICAWTVPLKVEDPFIGAAILIGGSIAWVTILAVLTTAGVILVATGDYLGKQFGIG